MSPETSKTLMFLPIVKEVKNAIRESYSEVKDVAQIYDLNFKIWKQVSH